MTIPSIYVAGLEGEQYQTAAQQDVPLGTSMVFQDGRVFRYVENGGTLAVAGSLYASEAPGANFDELVVAAAAVGATTVTVTTGATAIAIDDFKEGFMNIEDDAGEGHLYKLDSHLAIGTTTAGIMNLVPPSSIVVALTSASTVGLWKNPYKAVVIAPSTIVTRTVALAVSGIAANAFGWMQVHGPASVLTDGVLVVGQHVRSSDGVAGAVEPLNRDVSAEDEQEVGVVNEISATGEHSYINLTIE